MLKCQEEIDKIPDQELKRLIVRLLENTEKVTYIRKFTLHGQQILHKD